MNKNIEFAKLGLGLFVHYGLFSVLGSENGLNTLIIFLI